MSMNPNKNYFKEFLNPIFIETGSYRGDGIQLAIDAGFDKIISIDIDNENSKFCASRFDLNNKSSPIFLFTGDSPKVLKQVLPGIHQRCTFWLDAHSMLEEDKPDDFPLMEELKVIAQHPIKNHTILIDDFLYLSHPDVTGWSKEIIEGSIRLINPAYKIEYRSNPVKNNILIAYV